MQIFTFCNQGGGGGLWFLNMEKHEIQIFTFTHGKSENANIHFLENRGGGVVVVSWQNRYSIFLMNRKTEYINIHFGE